MSNLEKWKAAKAAWWAAECEHNAARHIAIEADQKRSVAWEALVAAAADPGVLTYNKSAKRYEGPALTSQDRQP